MKQNEKEQWSPWLFLREKEVDAVGPVVIIMIKRQEVVSQFRLWYTEDVDEAARDTTRKLLLDAIECKSEVLTCETQKEEATMTSGPKEVKGLWGKEREKKKCIFWSWSEWEEEDL